MSSLSSTAPAAFDALLGLFQAAGAAQNPPVTVFDSELLQFEPGTYVILTGFEDHAYDWDSLGTFAFYETYNIIGYSSVYQGDVDPKAVRDATYALYNSVVQSTAVANRNPPISSALQSAGVVWLIPGYAKYTSEPGVGGGTGPTGYFGRIDFSYNVKARITVS